MTTPEQTAAAARLADDKRWLAFYEAPNGKITAVYYPDDLRECVREPGDRKSRHNQEREKWITKLVAAAGSTR